jgi:hypothetical protein
MHPFLIHSESPALSPFLSFSKNAHLPMALGPLLFGAASTAENQFVLRLERSRIITHF